LTWIFYLLARHPESVRAIRDEVALVIGDNPIDYKNLHELHGTVRVIDEALRLYPPVLDYLYWCGVREAERTTPADAT